MKLRPSLLALVLVAAFLVTAPHVASADDPTPAPDPDVLKITSATPYWVGDAITLDANFTVSKKWRLSLWSDRSGEWAKVPGFTGRTATSNGNHVFTGYPVTGPENVQVRIDTGEDETNVLAIEPSSDNPNRLTITSALPYAAGENVTVKADFRAPRKIAVALHSDVSGDYAPVAGQARTTDSKGDASFTLPVSQAQNVKVVETAGDVETVALALPEPVPAGAYLDPITGSGSKVTATFLPARKNQRTELQVETIKTSETTEMPAKKWVTIATGKQDAAGRTSFSISDPLEVKHGYRAVSNGVTSDVVEFAAPLPAKSTGLPQVYFNTNEGASVNTRSRYFEGEFSMTTGSLLPQCQAIAPIKKSTMKGRGNYSWSFDKKSFTLKIDKSKNLCGMGGSKKWALVANHYDKSLIRNTVAYHLSSKFTNLAWSPRSVPVDLFVNGSYRGSYILIERRGLQNPQTAEEEPDVDKRNSARIDVPELKANGQENDPSHPNNQHPNITGGYILEWDFRKGGHKNITVGKRGYAAINDPEDGDPGKNEGISKQQVDYINDYVDKADAALFGSSFTSSSSGWRKYIDEASAVDYYLAMELMKPVDGNMWASVNMYKQRDGYKGQTGKLYFGPMWDFDLAAGSATRAGNVVSPTGWYLRDPLNISAKQSATTWFNRLNDDPSFRSAVRARWRQLYPELSASTFIEQQRTLLRKSADENWKKWKVGQKLSSVQVVKGSWSKEVDYLKSWMSSRRSWMNGQLG